MERGGINCVGMTSIPANTKELPFGRAYLIYVAEEQVCDCVLWSYVVTYWVSAFPYSYMTRLENNIQLEVSFSRRSRSSPERFRVSRR